jgi:hypothetical protein
MKKGLSITLAIFLPAMTGCTTIQRAKARLAAGQAPGAPHRGDVMPARAQAYGGVYEAPAPAGVPASTSTSTMRSKASPTVASAAPVSTFNVAGPDKPASDVIPGADPCQAITLTPGSDGAINGTPPVSSPSNSYVVTKFFRACTTRNDAPGLAQNSAWLAMGFPCSGGDGRVDWKGSHYERPKLVEMILANDCPMGPVDQQALKSLAKKELGIPMESTVGAYTPFMVQFWEIPAIGESDIGFSVAMRENQGLTSTWGKMIKGEPLRILLVGRENAWTQTDHLYMVEADISITSRNRFRLKPVSVKVMTTKEIEAVRLRCEALRPARNCSGVFQI